MKKVRAFTLVELMVVIVIIGILATLVVLGLGPARKRSRDNRRISDANIISSALDQYYLNNTRTYPVGAGACTAYVVANDTEILTALSQYLNPFPVDPADNTVHYTYVSSCDGRKAAVIVDKMETAEQGTAPCNITASSPPIVQFYKTQNPTACYFVAK
ncbi:MAG: type II secretion system protein [Candidatus Berkelbacteria bacterium]|nr:type II secretion system protein [Candidatus Berkelbacteria bacterium]